MAHRPRPAARNAPHLTGGRTDVPTQGRAHPPRRGARATMIRRGRGSRGAPYDPGGVRIIWVWRPARVLGDCQVRERALLLPTRQPRPLLASGRGG
jgi:hypothetical protein